MSGPWYGRRYRQPVESTRDPRTYHCVDSRHETCGAYKIPMDIQLYGWTAYMGRQAVDRAELPAGPGYLSPCGPGYHTIPYHTIPYHTYGYHVTMWGSAGTKEGRSDRRTGNYETGLSIRCYFHFVMKEHYFMDSMSNRTCNNMYNKSQNRRKCGNMCAEEKKYAAGAGVRDLHNGLQKEG